MISYQTELVIAVRNLTRNRSRTAVAISTVAIGLIAYLLAGGFVDWIFENMRESTIRSQLGHIQVVRPEYLEKGIADPYNYLLPDSIEALQTIETTPHVVSVAQRLAFSGLASYGENTVSFIAEGIEPQKESVISNLIHIRSGSALTDNDEASVIVGEGLAKALGVKSGDSLILLVTAANGTANAVELNVKGLFYTSSKEFDDSALRVPINIARKLVRVKRATTWVILLNETSQTNSVISKLQSRLPNDQYELISWEYLADFYRKTVDLFGRQLEVMKLIIGLIIVLTISNTQTMSVLERTTEIGTVLAMGSKQVDVLRSFIVEGTMIGIIGGVVGITVGWLMGSLLSYVGIPMPPPPGMEVGFTAEINFNHTLAFNAFFLSFVTTVLASILPAWRASRLNVVDALRSNQ